MEQIFAFDVDGTLTPPQQFIDDRFDAFFRSFAAQNTVYLVTGSDRSKLFQQLPDPTLDACRGWFTCSAAELWMDRKLIYQNQHAFPAELIVAARQLINKSRYPHRYGNHVERRTGMLNISTVGRNATLAQRMHYFRWDQQKQERSDFIKWLGSRFSSYEFSAGGQISIDIVPNGWTKAIAKQKMEELHPGCAITFFGDRMDRGGNDKPLGDALRHVSRHQAIAVRHFDDVWKYLQKANDRQMET